MGQRPIGATEQHGRPVPLASVAVQRDRDVDVLDERGQSRGRRRLHGDRRNVPAKIIGLQHGVQRRAGAGRDLRGDHVGRLLEVAAVERHQSERRSELADLLDARDERVTPRTQATSLVCMDDRSRTHGRACRSGRRATAQPASPGRTRGDRRRRIDRCVRSLRGGRSTGRRVRARSPRRRSSSTPRARCSSGSFWC